MNNKRFLILGASGQLAKEFILFFEDQKINYLAPAEKDLDITDAQQIESAICTYHPEVIVNCAAYNQVELAEDDPRKAFAVNTEAVEDVARLCKKYGVLLVHFSSDYVFDGQKNEEYIEDDATNPLNEYGKSKLAGECVIRSILDEYLIFRLSWVIGPGTQNFLYKLSCWAKGKKTLEIVEDEVSVPSFTVDIVKVVILSLQKNLKGIYHLTNSGSCSRYELAKYFVEKKGLNVEISPVAASYFPTKVKRPMFSKMSNEKISKTLRILIPHWKDGVDQMIARMKD